MKITDRAEREAWTAYMNANHTLDTRRLPGVRAALEAAGPHLLADDTTSDGFHTVGELYQHRMLLTAALFQQWVIADHDPVYPGEEFDPHKSWRHSSGELCFGGNWFIVVATLPTGQISYHYPASAWDMFRIPERELPTEYDGHTAADVAIRLERFLRPTDEPVYSEAEEFGQ